MRISSAIVSLCPVLSQLLGVYFLSCLQPSLLCGVSISFYELHFLSCHIAMHFLVLPHLVRIHVVSIFIIRAIFGM